MENRKIAIIYGYLVRHGGVGRYISETIGSSLNPQQFEVLAIENTLHLPPSTKVELIDCKRDKRFMSETENTAFSQAIKKMVSLGDFSLSHSHGVYDFIPDLYTAHICLEKYFQIIKEFFGEDILKEPFSSALPLVDVEKKLFEQITRNRIVAVSKKVAKELENSYGVKTERIIPGASRFPPSSKKMKNLSDIMRVGFVGNNIYTKGLVFLKPVLEKLSKKGWKIECFSAGTDHYVDNYMSSEGYSYIPLGKTEINKEFYQSLDCFLSLSVYEACPLSTLEAMSLSVPVISSRLNGVFLESFENGEKVLTEVEDVSNTKEISSLLERIFSENEFRNGSIEQGERISSLYSWRDTAYSYEKIYLEL